MTDTPKTFEDYQNQFDDLAIDVWNAGRTSGLNDIRKLVWMMAEEYNEGSSCCSRCDHYQDAYGSVLYDIALLSGGATVQEVVEGT